MFNCFELCVFVSLQDDAAAGLWVVVSTDFALVAVHVVDVALVFPLVVHLSDGDQLDRLPLLQNPGGFAIVSLMFFDQTLRGLRDCWVWKAKQWVDQVLAALEQLLPFY